MYNIFLFIYYIYDERLSRMIIYNMYTLEITWLIGVQLAFLVSKSYDTGPYDYANPVTSGSESSFGRGKV